MPIYPINPKHDELLGLKAYTSIHDLPDSPGVGDHRDAGGDGSVGRVANAANAV